MGAIKFSVMVAMETADKSMKWAYPRGCCLPAFSTQRKIVFAKLYKTIYDVYLAPCRESDCEMTSGSVQAHDVYHAPT